jgi:hypothetical protein
LLSSSDQKLLLGLRARSLSLPARKAPLARARTLQIFALVSPYNLFFFEKKSFGAFAFKDFEVFYFEKIRSP